MKFSLIQKNLLWNKRFCDLRRLVLKDLQLGKRHTLAETMPIGLPMLADVHIAIHVPPLGLCPFPCLGSVLIRLRLSMTSIVHPRLWSFPQRALALAAPICSESLSRYSWSLKWASHKCSTTDISLCWKTNKFWVKQRVSYTDHSSVDRLMIEGWLHDFW